MDGGERVDRIAHRREFAQHLERVLAAQQWAGVAPPHPLGQHLGRGVEPDGGRLFQDQRARLVIDEGAAAGGDHLGPAIDQPRDHAPLPVAKIGFAELFEDFGHAHAGGFLDRMVGIDEGHAQPVRQSAPYGRLAHAHQADKHDRRTGPA